MASRAGQANGDHFEVIARAQGDGPHRASESVELEVAKHRALIITSARITGLVRKYWAEADRAVRFVFERELEGELLVEVLVEAGLS